MQHRHFCTFFLVLVLSLLFLGHPAFGLDFPRDTVIQNQNVVWDEDVTIHGSVTFENTNGNYTLEIRRGWHIYFSDTAKLIIKGYDLNAGITGPNDFVYFRPLAPATFSHGYVQFLKGNNYSSAVIDSCVFDNIGSLDPMIGALRYSIDDSNTVTDSLVIKNSSFHVNGTGLVLYGQSNSTPFPALTPFKCNIYSSTFFANNPALVQYGIHIFTDSTHTGALPQNQTAIQVSLSGTIIENFGYLPGLDTAWQAGAAIKIDGLPSDQERFHWVTVQVLNHSGFYNCGNGILAINHRHSTFVKVSDATFTDFSGSAIYLYEHHLNANITNSLINKSGLDLINVGTNFTAGNDDYGDSLVVNGCVIEDGGFNRQRGMQKQANGVHVGAGSMRCRVSNSVIRRIFSNGIKLYKETDTGDNAAYTHFLCDHPLAPHGIQQWPLDTNFHADTVHPIWQQLPMLIYDCGTDFGAGEDTTSRYYHDPANEDMVDNGHGIRLANQTLSGRLNPTSIYSAIVYNAGIGFNANSGIAIRGNGYLKDSEIGNIANNRQELLKKEVRGIAFGDTNGYWGSIFSILGCAIDSNECGVDVTGDQNMVLVAAVSENDSIAAVNSWLQGNKKSGVRLHHVLHHSNVPMYNRIDVASSYPRTNIISHNGDGGVNCTERFADNTHQFKLNYVHITSGVSLIGTADGHITTDYGVSLESDFADSNIVVIDAGGSVYSFPPPFPKGHWVPLPINGGGPPADISLFSQDGVFICGKRDSVVISPANIHNNLRNGIYLDANSVSQTSLVHRDSLGLHELTVSGSNIKLNSVNGLLVKSSDANRPDRYGRDSVWLGGSYFNSNRDSAGVWLDEFDGVLRAQNCWFGNDTASMFQFYGILERSTNHYDTLFGGYACLNLFDGIRVSDSVMNCKLVLFRGMPGFLWPYWNQTVSNVGPLIAGNHQNGIYIRPCTLDRNIKFIADGATIAQNWGIGLLSSIEPSEGSYLRQCRFYRNFLFEAGPNIQISDPARSRSELKFLYNEFFGSSYALVLSHAPREFTQNVVYSPHAGGIVITQTTNPTGITPIFKHNTILCDSSFNGSALSIQGVPQPQVYGNVIQIYHATDNALTITGATDEAVNHNIGWCTNAQTRTWADMTSYTRSPSERDTVGDPKIYLPQENSHFERYRFHLERNSKAIDATPYLADGTSERDYNNTIANYGAFGGGANLVGGTLYLTYDTTATLWRAGPYCVIPSYNESTSDLRDTLKSESYIVVGDVGIQLQANNLTVEKGVELLSKQQGYYNGSYHNGGKILLNGAISQLDTSSSRQPYTLYGRDSTGWYFRPEKLVATGGNERWDSLVFNPTCSAPSDLKNLWIEGANGTYFLADPAATSSTLTLRNLTLIHRGSMISGPAPSMITLRDRHVDFRIVRIDNPSLPSNNLTGIYLYNTQNAPTHVSHASSDIDSLFMNDPDTTKTAFWRNIWVNNTGKGFADTDHRKSLVLRHCIINDTAAHAPLLTSPGAGILITASLFRIDSIQVLNIKSGNALDLQQIPSAPTDYHISNSRFAYVKGGKTYDQSNGVKMTAAYPLFDLCNIDHNGNSGAISIGASQPFFGGTAGRPGNLIHDNLQLIGTTVAMSDSMYRAQYTQICNTGHEPAPYVAWNQIFSNATDPNFARSRLIFRNILPDSVYYMNDTTYKIRFNGVWWGVTDTNNLTNRMYATWYHPGPPLDTAQEPTALYRNPLPNAPDDGIWTPSLGRDLDAVRHIIGGDYPGAGSILSDLINDEQADWQMRAHAVPLLFGVNNLMGWTFEQNLALQESLATRFTGTDMYPVVRNYKPLLALLHDKPDLAYETYQQFQLFPLCYEDSIATAIALLELKPVMGPDNKVAPAFLTEQARVQRIHELEQLLISRGSGRPRPSTNSLLPTEYKLHSPYPNPFNSVVRFQYDLPKMGKTQFVIYNTLGREVFRKDLGVMQAGKYLATWEGRNKAGRVVGSGVYFLRFTSDNFQSVKKVVLVK